MTYLRDQILGRAFVQLQLLGRVLRVVPNSNTMVFSHFTLRRIQLPNQQLQQGGFANAIGPDNRNSRAHVDTKVDVFEQWPLSRITKSNIVQAQNGRCNSVDVGESEQVCEVAGGTTYSPRSHGCFSMRVVCAVCVSVSFSICKTFFEDFILYLSISKK